MDELDNTQVYLHKIILAVFGLTYAKSLPIRSTIISVNRRPGLCHLSFTQHLRNHPTFDMTIPQGKGIILIISSKAKGGHIN